MIPNEDLKSAKESAQSDVLQNTRSLEHLSIFKVTLVHYAQGLMMLLVIFPHLTLYSYP